MVRKKKRNQSKNNQWRIKKELNVQHSTFNVQRRIKKNYILSCAVVLYRRGEEGQGGGSGYRNIDDLADEGFGAVEDDDMIAAGSAD